MTAKLNVERPTVMRVLWSNEMSVCVVCVCVSETRARVWSAFEQDESAFSSYS